MKCRYCKEGIALVLSENNDCGASIAYPNKLVAFGYNRSYGNVLITEINYCPMCGRKLIGGFRMKRYTLSNMIFDIFMLIITGGLWFIWMFIRFLRSQ